MMTEGWVGAAFAAVPIALVLGLMGIFRVKGHYAVLWGLITSALLALLIWQQPTGVVLAAGGTGLLKGLFPVVYIVVSALLLYNLTVATGYAFRLRSAIEAITRERTLHLLLIGFGFAAFLDATAGFLTPFIVSTAMLVSLGFAPMMAASYTLVGAALPSVFGAMGISLIVMADVAGFTVAEFSPVLSLVAGITIGAMPVILVGTFSGWKELRRLWIPVGFTSVSYALALILTATYLTFAMAALFAAVATMLGLGLGARLTASAGGVSLTSREFLQPWLPYFLLASLLLIWSLPAVKQSLSPGLGSPGTAILLSVILFGLTVRAQVSIWSKVILDTWNHLKVPAISICTVFAMAEIMKAAGLTAALGSQVSNTGQLFPLLSPLLQWAAAAATGSSTTSIAIMGGLQASSARALGIDPLVTSAFVAVAASVGKMAAPQILTAGAVAAGLSGQEGALLKIGIRYSLSIVLVLGIVAWFLA